MLVVQFNFVYLIKLIVAAQVPGRGQANEGFDQGAGILSERSREDMQPCEVDLEFGTGGLIGA